MTSARHICCLLALLLHTQSAAGVAAPSFEQQLVEADGLRSIDAGRFAALLDELEARSKEAAPIQLQRLRYLRAYQTVVYRNQADQGAAEAEALFKEVADVDLRFRAGSLIANSYAITRNFKEGLRYLHQILPMRHRVQDKDIRHDGIDSAAALYNELGQYELGLMYAEETLFDKPNPRARCAAGFFRLQAQFHLGALPEGDESTQLGIKQCLDIGDKLGANFIRVVLARKHMGRGEHDAAIHLLENHLAEVEAVGYHRLLAEFHAVLAELKLAKGQAAAAQQHAQAIIDLQEVLPNSLSLVVANKVLYEVAERSGDPSSALVLYRRYAESERAHLSDVKARELAYEIVRHETLQKDQQIQLLDQQNQVLQLRQRVQQQYLQNMGLLAVLLGSLAAAAGYWAYGVKRMHLSLRRFAETDGLTGISNRHHFTQQSEHSLAGCASAGGPAALILFDLDHFKAINDTYGHETGDWVLKQVADTCRAFCRRIDHLGRIGGEEFAILLHGCDLQAATRLAGDCRVRLSRIDTRASGYAFAVTASFGVSATSLSGYRLSALMSHADLALYRAKREGRNRVTAYTRDDVPVSPRQALPTETPVAVEAVSSDAAHA